MKTEFSHTILRGPLSLLSAIILCWSVFFLVAHDFIQYNCASKQAFKILGKDISEEEKSNNTDDENSDDSNKKISGSFLVNQVFLSITSLQFLKNKSFHNYSDDLWFIHCEIVSPPPEI